MRARASAVTNGITNQECEPGRRRGTKVLEPKWLRYYIKKITFLYNYFVIITLAPDFYSSKKQGILYKNDCLYVLS